MSNDSLDVLVKISWFYQSGIWNNKTYLGLDLDPHLDECAATWLREMLTGVLVHSRTLLSYLPGCRLHFLNLSDLHRPLSVPFLFRSSGKETDTATMLRLEKYGRIEFTPGKWTTTGQNALKWMSAYARVSGTFDGFNFHSFFRLWQLVLWMSYHNLLPIYSKGSWIIEEMLLWLAFVTKWCYFLYCYYMLRDNVRN